MMKLQQAAGQKIGEKKRRNQPLARIFIRQAGQGKKLK
jgi:hypothetical protein